jgi:hypothetical protein
MSDKRTLLEDPKDKRPRTSRDEKHRKELEARKEPTQYYAGASGATNGVDKPIEECKAVVFQILYIWFIIPEEDAQAILRCDL